MKALLLIGFQVDFLPGGGAEASGSETLIPLIDKHLDGFDLVVAANFSLPVSHKIFAANHPWRRPGQTVFVDDAPLTLQNFFCIRDSFGAEYLPGFPVEKVEFAASIGTDPQHAPRSAFRDEGELDTGLMGFLQQKNVRQLYLAGMPAETLVRQTALEAHDAGFEVFFLQNACKYWSATAAASVLKSLKAQGISVVDLPYLTLISDK
jgi:nicotinamidase/pyrazinamidase